MLDHVGAELIAAGLIGVAQNRVLNRPFHAKDHFSYIRLRFHVRPTVVAYESLEVIASLMKKNIHPDIGEL
jgi:hypothetical protein